MKRCLVVLYLFVGLAFAETFTGLFIGTDIQLFLEVGEPMHGSLSFQGQSYPVTARVDGNTLTGEFIASGQTFAFEAVLAGDSLSLSSGGSNYTLMRQLNNPLVTPSPQHETGSVILATNQPYQAGTRLNVPLAGVSFVVPEAFTAAYDPEVEAVLMSNADQSLIMAVFAVSQASLEDMASYLLGKLEPLELDLQLRQDITQTATSLRAVLSTHLAAGPALLVVAEEQGAAGNVLAVAALGLSKDENRLQQLSDGLLASASWSTPEVQQLAHEVGGVKLRFADYDHTYSAAQGPSDSNASLSGRGDESYDFCSSGEYRWQYKREVVMSNDAGYLESTETDQHQGNWLLLADIASRVYLYLETTDEREMTYLLNQSENGRVVLDNKAYEVLETEFCQ